MSPVRRNLAAAVALSLIIVGCSSSVPTPTPSAPSPGTDGLAGRTFLSTEITEDGAQRDLVPDTQIRLEFRTGELGASAGCNLLGGPYQLIGGQLGVGPMHMTDMGCDPARHAQDEWLINFLGARPSVELDDMTLVLAAGDTRMTFVDRRVAQPDLELVGPLWVLDTIIDGETASSVPGGVVASLRFAQGGRVDVAPGCNTGGGEFSVEDDRISFSPIGLTRMACPGVEGDVERVVLEVLGAADVRYSIEADSLALDAGRLALVFRAEI